MISNANIYLAIAEEALSEAQHLDAHNRVLKMDGEPGFILAFDPEQKSFKKSLIAIAFSAAYIEAIFYIAGIKKFGKKYAKKYDSYSYTDKLLLFKIEDSKLLEAAENLRKIRKDLLHEKAMLFSDPKHNYFYFAQNEAIQAVHLARSIACLL